MTNTNYARRPLAALLACAAIVLLTACPSSTRSNNEDPDSLFEGTPDGTYTTRGVIAKLPESEGEPAFIQHEPIDDFADADGVIVGMNAMLMEFPDIAQSIDLERFEPGEKVELTFDVYWKPSRGYIIRRMSKLEGDPELILEGRALPNWKASLPQLAEGAERYIARGYLLKMPDAINDLVIRHERIPDLKNEFGEVVGMPAMDMTLQMKNESDLDGFKAGDKVVFAMDVSFDEGVPSFPVVGIAHLASTIELDVPAP